jgi:hypothetical protein
MPLPNPSCAVALPRVLKNATETKDATSNATATAPNARKPASLLELRAQLRAQLVRNYSGNCETEKQAELRTELRTSESATATDPAELRVLVNRVADYHGFTAEQRAEALQIALADQVAALECFRALAANS